MVHVVCVQVVDAVCDGERDVELDVERMRFAPGSVLLQRHAHAFHVDDAVLDVGDAHQMRVLRNVQEFCRRLHCSGCIAALGLAHRDAVCHEKHAGLAAVEAGPHLGGLHVS